MFSNDNNFKLLNEHLTVINTDWYININGYVFITEIKSQLRHNVDRAMLIILFQKTWWVYDAMWQDGDGLLFYRICISNYIHFAILKFCRYLCTSFSFINKIIVSEREKYKGLNGLTDCKRISNDDVIIYLHNMKVRMS